MPKTSAMEAVPDAVDEAVGWYGIVLLLVDCVAFWVLVAVGLVTLFS